MFSLLSGKFLDFLREQYQEAFGGSLGESIKEAIEPETINFLGVQVNPSLFTALGVTVFMLICAVLIRIFVIPRFKKNPKGLQLILEYLVGIFDKSASVIHKQGGFVGMYIFTASVFIALGTLVELLGFRPAFADINTCFSMGIMTFLIINFCSIREKSLFGRMERYFILAFRKKTNGKFFFPIINPINVLSDLVVPLSLSLRLFGSITSGFIIMELVYAFLFTSFVVPSMVAVITTLFHALIQAFIFSTLTVIFVGEAME